LRDWENRRLEVGNWKLEVGSWKLEVGSWFEFKKQIINL
jgi:hypothetical protein